jgi:cellulose synthase/poly-beta-1,6-N-acetylglucosamine synthase-like glycosyltransferase
MTLSSTRGSRSGGASACAGPDRLGENEKLHAEIWLTRACVTLTLAAFATFVGLDVPSLESGGVLVFVYLLLVSGLVYGGLVYQVSRLSWLRRVRAHGEGGHSEPASFSDAAVAILVPSYKEEPAVVRQTLLSAALQNHPNRRVALLIDDPPEPDGAEDRALLDAMRRLPDEISAELAVPAGEFQAAREAFEARIAASPIDAVTEASRVATLYERASAWLSDLAERWQVRSHMDRAFVDWILIRPAEQHRATADQVRDRVPDIDDLALHYRRLAWMFDVELSAFERKRFSNLSREPNKAMNLNSYIALLGTAVCDSGGRIETMAADEADSHIDDVEYVLTLDADSIILPGYTSTLVELMERPEHARTAVAQTPYSAFPGAPGALERLAGATTDMQYIVHQGFTPHQATYWVGANALLRKSALEDIATCVREGPVEVRKFIQDRTVIEDTESSIDLVRRGWALHNHPERLAFSATPPDYGALIVQRRRWANGGLIILPKLLRHLVAGPWRVARLLEGFLRVHYLLSIAATNIALVALFVFPFPDSVATAVLPLTAIAYFVLYGRDLRRAGYRRFDVARVYALNLLLVGANLAGVLRSIHQAVTGRRSAFKRTPKVSGRTAAPPMYVVLPYAALVYLSLTVLWDALSGNFLHAALSIGNVVLLTYAVRTFVGWRAAREDATPLLARLRPRNLPLRVGA